MNAENKERRIILRSGTRAWYLFKILQLALIFFSLLLLCLSRFMFTVVDNFTVAYNSSNSTRSSSESSDMLASKEDEQKERNKALCKVMPLLQHHTHTPEDVKLVDLLIMFPCCFTIIIIIVMEILSHILQDAFNKWSNLIYLCLADGLSICIFAKSIESSIENWQFNTVCNVIFSGVLQVIIAINIILLCFS